MRQGREIVRVLLGVGVLVVLAGCGSGGGGGLSGIFGGGSSDSVSITSAITPSEPIDTGTGTISPVQTVTNPEPASLALFGGGLAGLAYLRRKARRRSSPTSR